MSATPLFAAIARSAEGSGRRSVIAPRYGTRASVLASGGVALAGDEDDLEIDDLDEDDLEGDDLDDEFDDIDDLEDEDEDDDDLDEDEFDDLDDDDLDEDLDDEDLDDA